MENNSTTWVEKVLRKPHVIIAFLALFVMAGIFGYNKIHRNLFPNSNYPEVAVVIVEPGSSAKTIASNIAVPVEEELYALDQIRRAYSTTIDEVTVIRAEFEYTKDIDTAVNDVTNALSKVRSKLPKDIREPQIIKITEATAPILVVAMSPKKGSSLSLEDIRDLAGTEIKHKLLKTKGVANVDIFGGYEKELQIIIDKNRLDTLHLSLGQVIATIQKNDSEYAVGFVSNEEHRYLLKAQGKREKIDALRNLPITPEVKLSDVAEVYFGHYENSAAYFGNGKEAIALSIQRSITADVIKTIDKVEAIITDFREKYPNIDFEVSDTQKETIEQSTMNMFESLRDAIVMSTIVVFLFLASFRQILVVLVTIPLVYASTIALMWLVGIDFNVVTLTAIILALGLLLDDTVVVMENIERHYRELGKKIHAAVFDGTKEIMFADFSGTVTTMIALSPMLFIGGYPQTVFAPLVGTLLLALIASYIISIIAVPLLSLHILAIQHPLLLKVENGFHKVIGGANDYIQSFFANIVRAITASKVLGFASLFVLIALFVTSVKFVMPTVGQELMPPMDTGGVNINITTDANLPIEKSEALMKKVNKIIKAQGELLRISGSIGSEAGVLSIGSGSGIDHLQIVATYVDRHHRKEDIWQIAKALREEIARLENVKYLEVTPYGATALASIRATVDAKLSASNIELLQDAGAKVKNALAHTKGVVSASTTWDADKVVYNLNIDEAEALHYGLKRSDIVTQLQLALRGAPVASFAKTNSMDYTVRVWLPKKQINHFETIMQMLIDTNKGKIPLSKIATLTSDREPSLITREGLQYTLEVYGDREKAAVSHIMASFEEQLAEVKLPKGVELEQIGDIKQFKASAERMVGAIITAVILIFLTLIVMFGNFKISLMILFSIPLTIIGASWTMLAVDYHVSMPAMMGFMLLSGVIVNNAILLIHFALEQINAGINKRDAMLEAIKIRTRPVLMTAFAVSVGMLPVAQGAAIGLERLAPLGAVAIGGLIVGTFMTLVFIPVMFIWTVKEQSVREDMAV
ncbi:efflux RND transporter permease subunit [Sulfurovum sp. ST-21]|uniref:Efflux RND transporter permease subunit n=1 Tax=Sulfurovum indicum TaxID=2779528 RepID=A0A7M1S4C4_9BACT|nr:efflux RND transporter permease subunit [Sulfurovum indicum]QOR61932.1 efflux RND transporter permease subunit [Sulfurovum indicum]